MPVRLFKCSGAVTAYVLGVQDDSGVHPHAGQAMQAQKQAVKVDVVFCAVAQANRHQLRLT